MTEKKENIVEAEVVEEGEVITKKGETKVMAHRSGMGIFWGTILLVWGLSIFIDTYFHTDIRSNIWPILAIVFGVYLIISSSRKYR